MVDCDLLKRLLQMNEGPKLEFKLQCALSGPDMNKIRDELIKDILALTNTIGQRIDDPAYLIIGAGDELKADGTRDRKDVRSYKYSSQRFLQIVNNACDPRLQELIYEEIELEENFYGVIVLPPSPYIHALTRDLNTPKGTWRKNSIIIRRGDETTLATREEIRLMEEQKKLLTHTLGVAFPEPQLVRWGPKDNRPAGISINSAKGLFVPWEELKDEIEKKLLIQIRIIPSDSKVILNDFHGRRDWIVKFVSSEGKELGDIWFGVDPLN
jgi:schlafen family protein